MEHTYQPLFDRVVLKRHEENTHTSAGGIIIPDAAQEKSQIAEVVAVGAGRLLADGTMRPLSIKAGQRVLLGKYSGTEVEKDIVIAREDDILAIVS